MILYDNDGTDTDTKMKKNQSENTLDDSIKEDNHPLVQATTYKQQPTFEMVE